jgi:hypothetical protein
MNQLINQPLAPSTTMPYQRSPIGAWIGIIGFIGIIGLFLVLGLGRLLQYVYPLLAMLLGLFLYSRYAILYSGLTWWLWFLTPLVRRLVDYRIGFTDPSPILLAPFLVSLIAIPSLLKAIPQSRRRDCLPYTLAFASVMYGLLVGLLSSSSKVVLISLLEWLSPIVFSAHLFLNWRQYPLYKQHIYRVFLVGVLITGAYGIYQYLMAPEWDRIWLEGTKLLSAGQPEPMKIRVWSTMHSPGVFAPMMMAGLILLINSSHPIGFGANALGYLAFLLSLVRAAWLGWVVAIVTLITTLKPRFQMQMIVTAMVLALLITPLAANESFSQVIGTRLSSFSDISTDQSKQDREETYHRSMQYALTNFVGDGLSKGEKAEGFDSGILTILISLGWVGAIPYVGALSMIIMLLIKSPYVACDPFAAAAKSITLAMLVKLLFGFVMLGLPGMILWSFASLGLAGHKYYSYLDAQKSSS